MKIELYTDSLSSLLDIISAAGFTFIAQSDSDNVPVVVIVSDYSSDGLRLAREVLGSDYGSCVTCSESDSCLFNNDSFICDRYNFSPLLKS